MNSRQKAGIGLSISGVVTLLVGIFALAAGDTPLWIKTACDVLAMGLPLLGFVVNFPSETNPK